MTMDIGEKRRGGCGVAATGHSAQVNKQVIIAR